MPNVNVIEITDFSDPRLDVYARLTEAELFCKYDPSRAMFIAESPKVIERALDFGCVPVSMLPPTPQSRQPGPPAPLCAAPVLLPADPASL